MRAPKRLPQPLTMSPFRHARAVLTSTLLAGVCLAASAQQDAKPQDVKPPAQEAKPAAQEAKPAAQDPKPPAADSKQPQTRLRSGVDLVSLNVTVTDGAHYVTDLDEEDFEVFEDGAQAGRSTFFSNVQQPIALAMLLDTSASMDERLATAQEAAIGFARRMRREDVMEVIDFDSQVSHPPDVHQRRRRRSRRPSAQTDVNGSTSLYNAIYISLKELKKARRRSRPTKSGAQAIVVLSDGDDTSSLVAYEEVLDLAKRSETAIYAIGLRAERQRPHASSRKPSSCSSSCRRKPAAAPSSPDASPSCRRSTSRSPKSSPTSTPSRYSSTNPMRNGAWRRVVVRVNQPRLIGAHAPGLLRPGPRRR